MLKKQWLVIEYDEKDNTKQHPSYFLFDTIEKVYQKYGNEGWERKEDSKSFPSKWFVKKSGRYVSYWGETFYTVETYILLEVTNFEYYNN